MHKQIPDHSYTALWDEVTEAFEHGYEWLALLPLNTTGPLSQTDRQTDDRQMDRQTDRQRWSPEPRK